MVRLRSRRANRGSPVGTEPDVRIPGGGSDPRVDFPQGLGLSDHDIRALIAGWIVPQLIRTFVMELAPKRSEEECVEKKPPVAHGPRGSQSNVSNT